jgi:lipopolysaccharide export system permease protein
MVFGILQRSILAELFKVFIPSLIGITGLIVLATIVKEASDRGLSPEQILVAISLIVPSMMPFIIPPTSLFAACVVYGRLAHDNEILAVKAAGINILHVLWPATILGLGMSGILFVMYAHLIPSSFHVFRTAIVNDAEEYVLAFLKRDHEIRRTELNLNWEIWVEQVHGRQLRNAIFKRRDAAKQHYDVIARAQQAEIRVDRDKKEVVVVMRHGEFIDEAGKNRVHFEEREYSVPLPEMDKKRIASPRELTWLQLMADRQEYSAKSNELAEKLRALEPDTRPEIQPQRNVLRFDQNLCEQRLRSLSVELHLRPALACGCFFFVLVGCPVGIWFSRSDYLSAFITCFLPIVFVYYPLHLCFSNFAKDGKVDPFLAHWVANGVIALIALVLFRKLLKN